jgi:hypothetical protein
MKRAAQERIRTLNAWKRHLAQHARLGIGCACERQPGRFRKGERVGGCGRPRCWLCHGEKLAGIANVAQRRAMAAARDGFLELER